MKIRKKLLLGFGLLFAVVLIFGGVCLYYIEVISETSNVTIKNNYETLTFTREMRSVLDENELPLNPAASGAFDHALIKQEHNITEPGEREATAGVRAEFTQLTNPGQNATAKRETEKHIRQLLNVIDGLNMRAIVLKNDATHQTVNRATLYLGAMVFVTFLILFVLISNFPAFIIDPLNDFKDALHQLRSKNYDTRLNFKTSREFSELAHEFNMLAGKLGEEDNANLTRNISDEIRIAALIEEMPDAVIGVNEKQHILFINSAARKLLHLNNQNMTGKSVWDLAKGNDLLTDMIGNKETLAPLKIREGEETVYFSQKNLEIVAPNLKFQQQDVLQLAGYPAGMIYVFKKVTAHPKAAPKS